MNVWSGHEAVAGDHVLLLHGEHITRQIHSDAKKRRSFLALHFVAGDLRR